MFSELIVGYLFLAGTGAGACLVLAVMGLCVPRSYLNAAFADHSLGVRRWGASFIPEPYVALFSPPYLVALVFLVVGMVCLMVHLGHTDRLVLLITRPRLSYITIGAYALALCVLIGLIVLFIWRRFLKVSFTALRVFQVLLAACSLVVMTYTGLFLASMRAVPLWSTPWLPVLFLVSSVSCGIGLVTLVSQLTAGGRAFSGSLGRLARSDIALIMIEGALIAVMGYVFVDVFETAVTHAGFDGMAGEAVVLDLSLLSNTDLALLTSFWDLAFGAYAQLFWFVLVLVGLIVPLALDIAYVRMRRPGRGMALAASICVLIGGYALRHCVVLAGVQPALIVTGVM